MITIMGGLAQEESTSISQNMRWSVQKRMQNGTYKISRPPFGFDIVNNELTINEEQAQIVNQIRNLAVLRSLLLLFHHNAQQELC